MRKLLLMLGVLAGCGDDGGGSASEGGGGTSTTGSSTSSGSTGTHESSGTGTGSGGTTEATPTTGGVIESGSETSSGSGAETTGGMKFDLPVTPDAGRMSGTVCRKVDLLFVIDNSQSMLDEQQTLVASFPEFVATMQAQLANADSYHVGVTTTDAYVYNQQPCVLEGALVTRTGGMGSSNMTCAPYTSGKRWMDETEDLASKFACAGQVGTYGHGDEIPMHTMLRAVSPELNAPGACNDGFIREDALLVVVVITDEEDDHEEAGCGPVEPGSPGEPIDWFNGLVAAKGGVESNIVVLSLIGPVDPQCPKLDKCGGGLDGAEVSNRITQFTEMFTNGSVGPICAPSYEQFFADAISVIDSACEEFTPPM